MVTDGMVTDGVVTGDAADTYEVLAVRYGTRTTTASEVYLNYHQYGEPDRPVEMDYFFWVARNAERTVVVDTGFSQESGGRRGRTTTCPPPEALRRLGIDPGQVGQVVITHAHYDHTGNLGLFPAAEVLISQREMEFWTGPYSRRAQFLGSAELGDLDRLARIAKEGRATLVTGWYDVAPGIELVEVGGHTPGQLVVLVRAANGPVVLASDAVHYYEEYELDRPFAVVADLEGMYRGFDRVRELAAAPGAVLVAGHDPEVMRRFPLLDPADPGFAVRVG